MMSIAVGLDSATLQNKYRRRFHPNSPNIPENDENTGNTVSRPSNPGVIQAIKSDLFRTFSDEFLNTVMDSVFQIVYQNVYCSRFAIFSLFCNPFILYPQFFALRQRYPTFRPVIRPYTENFFLLDSVFRRMEKF